MTSEHKRYCYVCQVHHPAEQVICIDTRAGRRWRCKRSIQAASRPSSERDAFGRQQTALNQQLARDKAEAAGILREAAILLGR